MAVLAGPLRSLAGLLRSPVGPLRSLAGLLRSLAVLAGLARRPALTADHSRIPTIDVMRGQEGRLSPILFPSPSWDGTMVSACGPIRPQGDGLHAAIDR